VKAGKSGVQEIKEEKTTLNKSVTVEKETDTILKEYAQSPVVNKAVQQALEKFFQLNQSKQAATAKLAKLKAELNSVMENQNRLRENLKTVPQNSDPYKQFLTKFVKLENQIEELQDQVREAQAALEKKTKEYEDYYRSVSAE
jgi:chromosome segregation ATPase